MKVGYEISFTRHFYKPQPLRPLEQIRADILALEVWPKSGRKGLYSWQSMMGESGHAGRAI